MHAVCMALQSSSSTYVLLIDLLVGGCFVIILASIVPFMSPALWGGYFMYVIFAAAVFLTCSQQHVVDVLAVASLGTCFAAAVA